MRYEQRRETFFRERVDRVERFRGRARLELDELACLLEPDQRVGKAVRGPAEPGGGLVGEEFALRREEQVDDRCGQRPEPEEQGALEEAADSARLDDRACEDRDGALDQDV